ncbi:CAP domain-containing protein [Paracoccus sp. Z118]|uniref:CAP domain-containing protein n=1 Tax=Paracoccus sp. Z118 TaxID=2851017 RepID=UPI0020B8F90D|nr:CAP domain-containing protein [Paracoccus sp. Z118]
MGIARLACAGILAAGLLAGCASEPPGAGGGDDPHAMQLLDAGQATCRPTTAAENAAGVAATNRARAARGLGPVRADARLAEAAAKHACDMAQRGRMTHIGSSTHGPSPRVKAAGYAPSVTAENIAAGHFDLNRVLAEWNQSSGHLSNIVIPQVRDFGIGSAVGADGKTRFWAAVYGAPR